MIVIRKTFSVNRVLSFELVPVPLRVLWTEPTPGNHRRSWSIVTNGASHAPLGSREQTVTTEPQNFDGRNQQPANGRVRRIESRRRSRKLPLGYRRRLPRRGSRGEEIQTGFVRWCPGSPEISGRNGVVLDANIPVAPVKTI